MIRKNDGFTLIEVIISIAVLSIVSVIFLQLFVKAKDIDDSSYALDQSVFVGNSCIELLKGIDTIDDISELTFFDDYMVEKNNDDISVVGYFDEAFNIIREPGEFTLELRLIPNADSLTQTNLDESMLSEYLYDVMVQVFNDEGEILYDISTQVVIGKGGASND